MVTIASDTGRLVVGVSGSPGSLCALRFALALARRLDAPLVTALAWVPPGGDLGERRFPNPELRHVWAEGARKRLAEALNVACGSAPVEVDLTPVIIRGTPGPSLVQVADCDGDVLVIGAGRRGTLSRGWHGRVSRYCLSHARCPVLAVPHPATARELGLGPGPLTARRRDHSLNRALHDWGAAA